jgi:pyruvate,water dikinase
MSEVLPKTGFQSPYDVPTPAGAEGWEEMYPYYLLFDPERREAEEKRFWFYNGMHFPEPMPAFDMITAESCYLSIGLYQGRVFQIPTVLGIEHRVVNGYVYITANEVSDPAEIEKRLEVFLPRIGFYYQNWDSLVARWQAAVDAAIAKLTALEVPELPAIEDEQELLHDHRLGSNYRLMTAYDHCIGLYNELNQLHFELLLLAYGAYLTFFQFCQAAFPDMGTQVMTQMIAGYDTTMFRPDDELKALATAAIAHGVDGSFADGRTPADVLAELEESMQGEPDRRSRVAQAPLVLHVDGRWLLPPPPRVGRRSAAPVRRSPATSSRSARGQSLDRPKERLLAERERIAASTRCSCDGRRAQGVRGDARPLPPRAPARRGHKFFIEHWGTSLFFNKMREIGAVMVENGFFESADDIFYLNIHEVHEALSDLGLAWSAARRARHGLLAATVARRRRSSRGLRSGHPRRRSASCRRSSTT